MRPTGKYSIIMMDLINRTITIGGFRCVQEELGCVHKVGWQNVSSMMYNVALLLERLQGD
jgi:hypothetical protein